MLFKVVQNLLSNSMLKVNIRKRIWEVLETGNSHDKVSLYIDIFLISLINFLISKSVIFSTTSNKKPLIKSSFDC